MQRRGFISRMAAGTLGIGLGTTAAAYPYSARKVGISAATPALQRTVSINGHQATFYVEGLKEEAKILHVTDTHLFRDDARGLPYTRYSARMAKAYNQTTHWQSGETTHPEAAFEETLAHAKEWGADLVGLSGDIFSFPSEAAVEWVMERLQGSGLEYLYTTGNHDWHYEGMEGSLDALRSEWSEKRLKPLFQGADPLMAVREIKGVNVLSLDNSTYEITAAQLEFFRAQVQVGKPLILFVHIPLYAPGRSVGYGCGHPDWGWEADRNHELEGRQRWPKAGHTQVTMDFYREVFQAPNLLGVFAGHVHRQSVDMIQGIPQLVTAPNATGAFMELNFLPLKT
ncbi:MAG: metallophosphoesterase [Lunatimonas sp.]|uniref:metallophosphoesterase family protein n=1 Tax=Lunatimonas sp. TaxID=2060141 RepID=UPI00263AE45C|nr:metallophosphoesterase [Lunatimonas sp.]MCC5936799.1 metallophosphoesterase [Lunatimonas sp.]